MIQLKNFWLITWESKLFKLSLIIRSRDFNETKEKLLLAMPDSKITKIDFYWSEDIEETWLRIDTIKGKAIQEWEAKRDWWNSHVGMRSVYKDEKATNL